MEIRIIGVPMDLGAGRRGVDMGPSAIRIAGVADRLRRLGHHVVDDGERKNIKNLGVPTFTIEEIDKHGMAVVIAKALRKLRHVDMLHVSFDLDSIDPAVAPGVGTPVKGGLNYREAHLIMETLAESGRMTSLEVVEVNPILDSRNQSAEFAVEMIQSGFGKKIL